MTSFDRATALAPVGEREFTWDVLDGWHQGRGAWGGLSIGAMVRAVGIVEPDPVRRVRSLSMQITAPVRVGPHRVQVDPVRIGSGMSTWNCRVLDDHGDGVALGTVITGTSRRASEQRGEGTWSTVTAPEAPPASEVPLIRAGAPFPEFIQHFDFRVIDGLPLQGGPAQTLGWVGFAEPPAWSDVALAALVDAWFTVTLVPLAELVAVGTVSFTAHLHVDPRDLNPGEPLLHQGFVSAVAGGYASEHRRLWTASGQLAVDNLQTVVVG